MFEDLKNGHEDVDDSQWEPFAVNFFSDVVLSILLSKNGLTEDEILKIEKALDDVRKSTVLRIKTYKSMKVPFYGVHFAMAITTSEKDELNMLEKENMIHSLEGILEEMNKDGTKR
jgi:hypothetical protein